MVRALVRLHHGVGLSKPGQLEYNGKRGVVSELKSEKEVVVELIGSGPMRIKPKHVRKLMVTPEKKRKRVIPLDDDDDDRKKKPKKEMDVAARVARPGTLDPTTRDAKMRIVEDESGLIENFRSIGSMHIKRVVTALAREFLDGQTFPELRYACSNRMTKTVWKLERNVLTISTNMIYQHPHPRVAVCGIPCPHRRRTLVLVVALGLSGAVSASLRNGTTSALCAERLFGLDTSKHIITLPPSPRVVAHKAGIRDLVTFEDKTGATILGLVANIKKNAIVLVPHKAARQTWNLKSPVRIEHVPCVKWIVSPGLLTPSDLRTAFEANCVEAKTNRLSFL